MQCNYPDPPFDIPDRPIAPSIQALKRLVEEQFPKAAAMTSRRVRELWGSDEVEGLWFVEFARRTNDAIKKREETVVARHLQFYSAQLEIADDDARGVIDVSYVVNLLRLLDKRSQRWGWRRIPPNLKELYLAFWGKISPRWIEMLEAGSSGRKRQRNSGS